MTSTIKKLITITLILTSTVGLTGCTWEDFVNSSLYEFIFKESVGCDLPVFCLPPEIW